MTHTRLTARLRLEPLTVEHTRDFWLLHRDRLVAQWYAGSYTWQQAHDRASAFEQAWQREDVSKWMAYLRTTGECVGRGGLSRTVVEGYPCLELGWALFQRHTGQGYATDRALNSTCPRTFRSLPE